MAQYGTVHLSSGQPAAAVMPGGSLTYSTVPQQQQQPVYVQHVSAAPQYVHAAPHSSTAVAYATPPPASVVYATPPPASVVYASVPQQQQQQVVYAVPPSVTSAAAPTVTYAAVPQAAGPTVTVINAGGTMPHSGSSLALSSQAVGGGPLRQSVGGYGSVRLPASPTPLSAAATTTTTTTTIANGDGTTTMVVTADRGGAAPGRASSLAAAAAANGAVMQGYLELRKGRSWKPHFFQVLQAPGMGVAHFLMQWKRTHTDRKWKKVISLNMAQLRDLGSVAKRHALALRPRKPNGKDGKEIILGHIDSARFAEWLGTLDRLVVVVA